MAIPDKPLTWRVPVQKMGLGLAALMDDTEPMQYKMMIVRRLLRDYSDWEKVEIDSITFEELGDLSGSIMTSLAESAVPKETATVSEIGPETSLTPSSRNGVSSETSEKTTASAPGM